DNQGGHDKVFDGDFLIFFKEIKIAYRRNGQQSHEMYPKRKSYDKRNEDKPSVSTWIKHITLPQQAHIKEHGHKKCGHGIHFRLASIKPKTIGKGKGHRPDKSPA